MIIHIIPGKYLFCRKACGKLNACDFCYYANVFKMSCIVNNLSKYHREQIRKKTKQTQKKHKHL